MVYLGPCQYLWWIFFVKIVNGLVPDYASEYYFKFKTSYPSFFVKDWCYKIDYENQKDSIQNDQKCKKTHLETNISVLLTNKGTIVHQTPMTFKQGDWD